MAAKRALITGASHGLGRCLAVELASRGFGVMLVGRRRESLEQAAAKLAGSGHGILAADLADAEGAAAAVRSIASQPYDLLVNNAGSSRFGRYDRTPAEDLAAILQLNFVTPALLSRAFLDAAPAGSVLVNVTSIVGTTGAPGNAAYAAAKAGLQSLSESLWYEAAERGIMVMDFRPVSLETGFHQAAGGKSMARGGTRTAPERAARDLADAIERRRGLVYSYGPMAFALSIARRLLPTRSRLGIMGRQAARAGYL